MANIKEVAIIVGKAIVVTAATVVGAELGFAGGAAAMNDGIALSKKYEPKLVKVKGFGPFKKAVISTKNPFTGDTYTTTVKVRKVK